MDNCGIFDTHVHLDDEKFDADREELIKVLPELGVIKMTNIGANMESSLNSVNLSQKYGHIYASVGVHPHVCNDMTENDLILLNSYVTDYNKTVAIGEIGLDYHYDNSPRDVQKKWFIKQMELAKNLNMPVVLHIREAYEDALEILKYFGKMPANGVVHCFSGSAEFANEVIKLGYMIGVGGVVTFSNAKKLVNVVKEVELDNILLETDCPYMAPTPHRGERNNPAYIQLVADKIAEIKDISRDFVVSRTYENANRFFRIDN